MSKCKDRECCCKCEYQVEICSHPWFNQKSMLNVLYYGCGMYWKCYNDNRIVSSKEHGLCEIFSDNGKEIIDINEAIKILSVSNASIYNYIKDGSLKCLSKKNKAKKFYRRDVEEFQYFRKKERI